MRRFTKVCLWIFAICLMAGILLLSISWALGFKGWRAFRIGKGRQEEIYREIEGDIHSLELDVKAGSVFVEEGDAFAITEITSGKMPNSVVENGTWILEAGEDNYEDGSSVAGFYVDNEGIYWKGSLGEVHITIPKGTVFDHVSIETGAGSVQIEDISCNTMELELRAGYVEFYADVAKKLTGGCQAGSVNGMLAGAQEDFKMDVECSAGSVDVGDYSMAGLIAHDYGEEGTKDKELEISCEVGSINLGFFEKEE